MDTANDLYNYLANKTQVSELNAKKFGLLKNKTLVI